MEWEGKSDQSNKLALAFHSKSWPIRWIKEKIWVVLLLTDFRYRFSPAGNAEIAKLQTAKSKWRLEFPFTASFWTFFIPFVSSYHCVKVASLSRFWTVLLPPQYVGSEINIFSKKLRIFFLTLSHSFEIFQLVSVAVCFWQIKRQLYLRYFFRFLQVLSNFSQIVLIFFSVGQRTYWTLRFWKLGKFLDEQPVNPPRKNYLKLFAKRRK